MSASTLLELTERTKIGLSDNVKSNRIISDVRPSTEYLFKTKEKYFYEEAAITINGTNLFGSTYQFEIKQSEGYVGDFMLEPTFTTATATTLPPMFAIEMINGMTWRGGGNDLFKVSGEVMAMIMFTINPHYEDRRYLYNMFGGVGGDLVAAGAHVCYPIIGPGSKGILRGLTDDFSNPVWPVGKMNTSLILYIDIKATALVDVHATPTTKLTQLILRYKKYRMLGDIGVPTTSVGKALVYTTCVPYIQETEIYNTQGVTTTDYDLKSVITSGELQYIGFWNNPAASYANNDCLIGSELAIVKLTLGGNTILYQHDSTVEGDLRHLQSFKQTGQIIRNYYSSTTIVNESQYGRYYNIPISPNYSWDIYNFGSHGVNLNNETVRLTISTTTGVPRIKVYAVYKALINLYSDQTAKQKWDFSFNS
jgi:hypothetical protein